MVLFLQMYLVLIVFAFYSNIYMAKLYFNLWGFMWLELSL